MTIFMVMTVQHDQKHCHMFRHVAPLVAYCMHADPMTYLCMRLLRLLAFMMHNAAIAAQSRLKRASKTSSSDCTTACLVL